MKPSGLMGLAAAAAVLAAPQIALAGPAHVLASKVLESPTQGAVYAVAEDHMDGDAREALRKALTSAGLRVVSPDQPHTHLVVVKAQTGVLCTRSCSSVVFHDDAPLDDYYRHFAVVSAEKTAGSQPDPGGKVAWYVVLQKDGLSRRNGAALPALLRYGAKAYGREVAAESPGKQTPGLAIRPPQLTISPGA